MGPNIEFREVRVLRRQDFGTRSVPFTGTIGGIPEIVPGIDIKQTVNAVKFGINYRFGWGKAPVIASY